MGLRGLLLGLLGVVEFDRVYIGVYLGLRVWSLIEFTTDLFPKPGSETKPYNHGPCDAKSLQPKTQIPKDLQTSSGAIIVVIAVTNLDITIAMNILFMFITIFYPYDPISLRNPIE